ncbi:MAG: hypothetical protein QOH43_1823 [Solirubrobacteraceae bacterium]|jgi:lysophospholipase L1-like esterase|nr:hypothetical protein [Solirubrobacteraceae bacterium]
MSTRSAGGISRSAALAGLALMAIAATSASSARAGDANRGASHGRPAVLPVLDEAVTARTRAIYRRGLTLGNRPGVFAKVGDSNTSTGAFLSGVGCGRARLAGHRELEPTMRSFQRTTVPRGYLPFLGQPPVCRVSNSFTRIGFAAHPGWGVSSLLSAFAPVTVTKVGGRYVNGAHPGAGARVISETPSGSCPPGADAALLCELHTLKPSVAFVMIGTNDVQSMAPSTFRSNLGHVIAATVQAGTIPVLSTIPSLGPSLVARVAAFNRVIAALAVDRHLPLWDLWRGLAQPGMVNEGELSDHVHLSSSPRGAFDFGPDSVRYGTNLRNLQALQILAAIRRRVAVAAP